MKRKHIVFVFRELGTGGAQKVQAFVANTLVEDGYDVTVISMSNSCCTVNLDSNIKIEILPYESVLHTNNGVYRKIRKSYYLLELRRKILKLNPDAVCVFLSDVVRMVVLALLGTGLPIIGSERGDPNAFTKRQFDNYLWAYKKCAAVVFQLPDVAEIYRLQNTVNQKIIPNPCFPRVENVFRGSKDRQKNLIVSAGRLVVQKRFDVLIDAFAKVVKKHPEYGLIIYGDGPEREALYNKIHINGLDNYVELVGDVKDFIKESLDAKIFVLSSDYEGIPNVLLEAMAAGMPCISTDCSPGGAKFLLEDGNLGTVVPCGEAMTLSEAICNYIENPELRTKYSEKAIESLSRFESENIKKEWLDVFGNVLNDEV